MRKCLKCGKEVNPYSPKQYCNIECERGRAQLPKEFDILFPGFKK